MTVIEQIKVADDVQLQPEKVSANTKHYLDVGPEEEILVGNNVYAHIPYSKLFVFPQIRAGANPRNIELTESIEAEDLDNYLNVAVLDREGLEQYARFVSKIWRIPVDPNDFSEFCDDSGNYNLVIAGHSRFSSIGKVLDKQPNDGRSRAKVGCKVELNMSPQAIIAKQLSENIHKDSQKERQAIAIVEAFFWGLETGEYQTKADFIKKNKGKISRKILEDALHFAELPSVVRDHVFEGTLSYAPAIELGKLAPVIKEWLRVKILEQDSESFDSEAKSINEHIEDRLLVLVIQIQRTKINGPAAVKLIQGHDTEYRSQVDRVISGQEIPELDLMTPEEKFRILRAETRKEFEQQILALADGPISNIARALEIYASAGRNVLPPNYVKTLEARVRVYTKSIGGASLSETVFD